MTKANEIRLMNETQILYLKKAGKNYKRNEIIKQILEDEACFFKIDKGDAEMILKDIGVSSKKINEIYEKLISKDEYYGLKIAGKIDENDNEIMIKYESKDLREIFKNRKNQKPTTK